MRKYKCIHQQVFSFKQYKIVPLRDEDKFVIMKWRNEQIYHLRQNKPLTIEDQENYFNNVVSSLFEQNQPRQLLFSYLENDICIGYGGLVHINWTDKHAEISFLINTDLEKKHLEFHWYTYLGLIERVAFRELDLHRIFTFAFNVRPHLYAYFEKAGYSGEGILKDHYFWENKYFDAVIHAKLEDQIFMREANLNDLMTYYNWANNSEVRAQSFNSNIIDLPTHKAWFEKKIQDQNSYFYLFENRNYEAIGQVRIEKIAESTKAIIGISVDENFRGKGLASKLLQKAAASFLSGNSGYTIEAYIKMENNKSIKSFKDAAFIFEGELIYQGVESVLYILKNK